MNRGYSLFIGSRFLFSGTGSRLVSFISVLTVSGLVLGIALLIVVLSVMNGFDREMRTRILGVVPHIQLYKDGGIVNWQATAAAVAQTPGVIDAIPVTRVSGMLNFHGVVEPVDMQGVAPELFANVVSDVLPPAVLNKLTDRGILLSGVVAGKLGVEEGQSVTLFVPRGERPGSGVAPDIRIFEVAGIIDTHTTIDNSLALITLSTASDIAGLGTAAQGLRVRVDDIFAARDTGFALVARLPPGYSFVDWMQTHGNLYQAIQMSRNLVGMLIFLIIAIAVFNVVAMLVMTVVEKRPAIAILKTLGATNRGILTVFLVQGTLIGLFGAALGVVLGLLGASYVADVVRWLEHLFQFQFLTAEVYPIDYLPSDLRASDVVVVVSVALVLNFFATLYPAWLAARVRPADVLRYE